MMPKIEKIRRVYFDHAAATYMDKRAVTAMQPYFSEIFANPSSLYAASQQVSGILNDNRRAVARLVNALPENIIFTGSGTESDNMAIYGIARAHEKRGKHIISLAIEHQAVLNPLEDLKKQACPPNGRGWEVTYIKVNEQGLVTADEVLKAVRPDTVLVSIMYANNEMGAIAPIAEIGRKLLQYRKTNNSAYPYFHTDACQAAGYLDLDVEKLHVDLMTINGSKIYGPKGTGLLYIRRGTPLKALILGGGQERGLRSGTENIAGIVGFVQAFELAQSDKEKESARINKLVKYLWGKIQKEIPKIKLNGPPIGPNRLVNNLNVTFMDIEGEALLLYLDEYRIMCSTGSACTSESLEPSHVLTAMGLPYEYSRGSLRFTLGRGNSKKDIDYLMDCLPGIVKQLREVPRKII